MEFHPLCTLFPRVEGAEFAALKADIAANGLRFPIVVHEGMILDGGNRYRACIELDMEPEFVEFDGGNPASFVLSSNLHRRHLSPGQQAVIVSSATNWANAHSHGGNRKPDQGMVSDLDTVSDRMALSGAGRDTQIKADKLVKEHPEVAQEVTQGRKSLFKAVQETTAPKEPAAQKESPIVATAKPVKTSTASIETVPKSKYDKLLAKYEELTAEYAALKEAHEEMTDLARDLRNDAKELMTENLAMDAIVNADDQLVAAKGQIAKFKAIAENAEHTMFAKAGEYQARAKAVVMWKNRAEKAEKTLKKLSPQEAA